MAIDKGETTAQIKAKEVTNVFQCRTYRGDGTRISDPVIEVFRALVEKVNGGERVLFSPSQVPLTLPASKTPELIPYLEPSEALLQEFTLEQIEKSVVYLSEFLTMSFDALARKAEADEAARIAAQQQAISDEQARLQAQNEPTPETPTV